MITQTYSGFPEGLINLELESSHGKSWNFKKLKVMEFCLFLTNFFENEMTNFTQALVYVDTIFFLQSAKKFLRFALPFLYLICLISNNFPCKILKF